MVLYNRFVGDSFFCIAAGEHHSILPDSSH